MKAPFQSAIACLLMLFAARVAAAPALINLVDENAPLVLSVHDIPGLLKNWAQSPWARTWNDEQMKKFLAPLRAQMKIDEWDEQCKAECGYTVSELLAMAKGDALVAVTGTDFSIGDSLAPPPDLPLLFAIELGANTKAIAEMIAKTDEKEHDLTGKEDYAGVALHVYRKTADQGGAEYLVWAMTDGIWLLSPSKTTLQKSIDALQKGRVADPLGQSERYLRIKKRTGDANLTLLVNVQSLYPLIKKTVEARAESSGSQPMGMKPDAVLAALGLDAVTDFYFSASVGEGATEFNGGLTYSEMRGLLKLLAYRDGPAAQPAFVSEKWITVTTARFSVQDAYNALRELLDNINPMIGGMVQGQIKGLNKQLGVDLERDLLGSLGDEMIVASAMQPGKSPDAPAPLTELDQLYAFSLQNATAFTDAVEALKRLAGPQADKLFEKRDYLNHTIYTAVAAKNGPGLKGFSYAITPKYLFISVGKAAIVETALQGLDGKQPTLWQQSQVKEALADVPAKACTFEYQNTRAMIGSLIETLTQLAPMLAAKAEAGDNDDDSNAKPAPDKGPFDLSSKPDAATLGKYWDNAAGYGWRESQGFYFHSKLNHVK